MMTCGDLADFKLTTAPADTPPMKALAGSFLFLICSQAQVIPLKIARNIPNPPAHTIIDFPAGVIVLNFDRKQNKTKLLGSCVHCFVRLYTQNNNTSKSTFYKRFWGW
jgi:hypothetical protein